MTNNGQNKGQADLFRLTHRGQKNFKMTGKKAYRSQAAIITIKKKTGRWKQELDVSEQCIGGDLQRDMSPWGLRRALSRPRKKC
jgi:hypothetical protein